MPASIEDMAYTVGGAIVSPGLGTSELLLALLVGCGFALSAIYAACTGHRHEANWQEKPF